MGRVIYWQRVQGDSVPCNERNTMAKFYPLFSSSSGNASYIGGRNAGILIDAGVSCKRILTALERNGLQPECIQGIFITHTHSDHIGGLRVLLKKRKVPVFGTAETLRTLELKECIPEGVPTVAVDAGTVECAGFEITPFPTMHDAPGSCGYRIHTADDRFCAVCTDLGIVTEEVRTALHGCDMVLLESNYDPGMLRNGPYSPELKFRIQSEHGHLSNQDSADLAEYLVRSGTTRLLLGHLSPQNNTPALAAAAVLDKLQSFTQGTDYQLGIAPVETSGGAVIF